MEMENTFGWCDDVCVCVLLEMVEAGVGGRVVYDRNVEALLQVSMRCCFSGHGTQQTKEALTIRKAEVWNCCRLLLKLLPSCALIVGETFIVQHTGVLLGDAQVLGIFVYLFLWRHPP